MTLLHRLASIVRWVSRRRRAEQDLNDELQAFVDMAAADQIRGGVAPAEARRQVVLELGGLEQAKERVRTARHGAWLDDAGRDVSYGLRTLRRSPMFTTVALLTLALGIGATTAIFTLVRSVLLRPLPFPDPEALYVISHASPGPRWLYPDMSDRGYLGFREATRAFQTLATFTSAECTLTGAGDATRLHGAAVTTDFFRVLGVNAAAGRTFGPEDDGPGNDKIVLIGDGLWRSRFGADPGLVNRTMTLNGEPYRVVGILPAGFAYPREATYWIPLTVRISPNLGYSRPVIGRVKPRVTQSTGTSRSGRRGCAASRRIRRRPRDLVTQVTPLHEAMVGDTRLPLLVFGGAVGFVLLIACANVANLLLMRAVSRRHEIAMRLALGASRRRVVRQLLTEAALLSLAGGVLGAGIAMLSGPALLSLIPAGWIPRDTVVRVDAWVLLFTAGLSVLSGLVVGLAPIAQVRRDGGDNPLREGSTSATPHSHRLRHVLVVAEVALTLVLLVGAGLLVRSFVGLRSVPLGFTPERVTTMTMDLPVSRYPETSGAVAFHDRLLDSLSRLPGVVSAGAVNWLPLGDMVIWGDVQAEDRRDLAGRYNATKVAVSPDYFTTVGIRLLRGRAFTEADRRGAAAGADRQRVGRTAPLAGWRSDRQAYGARRAAEAGGLAHGRRRCRRRPPGRLQVGSDACRVSAVQPGHEPVLRRLHDVPRPHDGRSGTSGRPDARRAEARRPGRGAADACGAGDGDRSHGVGAEVPGAGARRLFAGRALARGHRHLRRARSVGARAAEGDRRSHGAWGRPDDGRTHDPAANARADGRRDPDRSGGLAGGDESPRDAAFRRDANGRPDLRGRRGCASRRGGRRRGPSGAPRDADRSAGGAQGRVNHRGPIRTQDRKPSGSVRHG